MNKNEKNEELQSRREFFKNAAKGALPILAFSVLGSSFLTSCGEDDKKSSSSSSSSSSDCGKSCKGGCDSSCSGSCDEDCTDICAFGCSGTCDGATTHAKR